MLHIGMNNGANYLVDDNGYIFYKTGEGIKPSKEWQMLGIANDRSSHMVVAFKNIVSWLRTNQDKLRYKNGKGKYRIIDLDHGTKQIQGTRITNMYSGK